MRASSGSYWQHSYPSPHGRKEDLEVGKDECINILSVSLADNKAPMLTLQIRSSFYPSELLSCKWRVLMWNKQHVKAIWKM